jgi:hypothetical protein
MMSARACLALSIGLAGLPMSAALTGTASAQTVEFRGDAEFSGFSAGCKAVDLKPGMKFSMRTRFRPPNVGDNDASTRFAFFVDYYATSFRLEKGNLGSSFKTVVGGGTGSSTWLFETKPKMRITKLSPSTISTATKSVEVAGEIQGFEEVPSCTAKFAGKLPRY